jgi:hypothetical protein
MIVQTTDAQAWWISIQDEIRPVRGLDTTAALAEVKAAFNFPAGPLFKEGSGTEFTNGLFRDARTSIVITKIALYSDGISTHVPSDTRNSEIVLQAALKIFQSFGVREPVTPPLHYYLSTIVADFETSLDAIFPISLLKKIGAAYPVEGDAQFSSVAINIDKTKIAGRVGPLNPTTFTISRRLDIPYEQNRYFSQANATTEKHLELLEEVERWARKSK